MIDEKDALGRLAVNPTVALSAEFTMAVKLPGYLGKGKTEGKGGCNGQEAERKKWERGKTEGKKNI